MTLKRGDRVVIADHEEIITEYRGRRGLITKDHGNGNATLYLDHHPFNNDEPGEVFCQTQYLLPEHHVIDELPV
jgi:hypothetical protein